MDIKYKIEFFDLWHCGSGLSAGADVDALVIKDKDNLPYIPGKTLKGLIREAVEELISLRDEWKNCETLFVGFFGNSEDKPVGSAEMKRGVGFFTDAHINVDEAKQITDNNLSAFLYKNIASTAIDSNGIAEKGSLRRIEVTIPLTLEADILNIPDELKDLLIEALSMVKRLGVNRNRGLGRCSLTVK